MADSTNPNVPPATWPPVDFRPDRTHYISAFVMVCILALIVGVRPSETEFLGFDSRWLMLLFVIPGVFVFWIARARTRVDATGVSTRPAFGASTTTAWDNIKGLNFKKSTAQLVTTDGSHIALPAVSFNSIPRFAEASRGRIPDVISEGRRAADDKVVVIYRDGRQVVASRDEYEQAKADGTLDRPVPHTPGTSPKHPRRR
ncbi:PH domain-containing protein [Corynebacterium mendelii]|uniref:PH domain-containing protein n=1 Tax=Corynebacterium mendelii TaxID=2765362 RepID=A0A939E1C7_9CORY|nr:PH domain-containing protein [Corynebacterium mendelii]MBN9644640.1 PH domain-containing protein [Corynebacterium mendelii]